MHAYPSCAQQALLVREIQNRRPMKEKEGATADDELGEVLDP
jgi:hypothetical protein